MAETLSGDGTQRAIGELSGQLTMVNREIVGLRTDIHDLQTRLAEMTNQFNVHLAYHKADEKYVAERQLRADREIQSRRWYRERLVQLIAAVIGSSAVGAFVSLLMRGHP